MLTRKYELTFYIKPTIKGEIRKSVITKAVSKLREEYGFYSGSFCLKGNLYSKQTN